MTVAQPTTPASYFHLLRWQVHSPLTRPMVVFTPKSLLRAKVSTSLTRDFTEGTFRPGPDDLVVTLRLLPGATWIADYYPVETLHEVPATEGGGVVVTLRTADTAWLRRLVWRTGGRAVVTGPQDVVTEVRTGADAALGAYAAVPPTAAPGAATPGPRVAGEG